MPKPRKSRRRPSRKAAAHITTAAGVMLGFSILAGASAAKPALGQVTQITEGLINTAIAYEISERCDSIGARWLRGVAVLNGLQNHARELGYTEDEIDAFTSNRAEKDRLEGIARARLVELGAQPGDEASHCAVGRAQIAAGTPVGQLLR